jgi:3'-phosphoadenosine 5'-phosphosulfate (PAPS) 3'-phosphatase
MILYRRRADEKVSSAQNRTKDTVTSRRIEGEMSGNWDRELEVAVAAVRAAGIEIARYYEAANAKVHFKAEDSPVTEADLASDRIIREHIAAAFPTDSIMTEEGADDLSRLTAHRLWIADPLDGTQQFIDRTGDFDVFLALVIDHRPIVAAIVQPTTGIVVLAVQGEGAWIEDSEGKRPLIISREQIDAPVRIATNRYHTPPSKWPRFVSAVTRAGIEPPTETQAFFPRAFFDLPGAPARYDAYLGIGPDPEDVASGGEWDVAAPDLVLNEAGVRFTNHRGELFQYNQPNRELRSGVIVAVDPAIHERLVAAVNEKTPG